MGEGLGQQTASWAGLSLSRERLLIGCWLKKGENRGCQATSGDQESGCDHARAWHQGL